MAGYFRYELIPPGSAVLCALSGGADSMYLLCRLLEGAERGGYTVCAAHFNHNLRPTARRDEEFVRNWCAEKGVPLTVGSGDVEQRAKALGQGLEECARSMRYAFLERTAAERGCTRIATGHHAGDNAETVLMNLVRGCGLRGLTGIPEQRGNLIRPMLSLDRAEILAYLDGKGVPHMEDESNADVAYTRNKIRRLLLPLLEELNPQAVRHINETAGRLREDEALLSQEAAALLDGEGGENWFPARILAEAPRPVALYGAALLLERAGMGSGRASREGALALAGSQNPSGQIDVPGGVVRREYDRLVFQAAAPERELEEVPLREGETRWGGWRIFCEAAVCPDEPGTPESFYLAQGAYTIRPRREGDGLHPPNRCYKTIKKWMIDQKTPRRLRCRVPILARDGAAAAAGGIGVDSGALARPGEAALHIILKEEGETDDC